MEQITKLVLAAIGAAAALGWVAAPATAASKRVIFSVDDGTSCKAFFNNDPGVKQLKLRRSSGQLTDGPHSDGTLKVDTDLGPNPVVTLSSASSSSSGFPTELVSWTSLPLSEGGSPTPVNALLFRLASTENMKVVYYPDALTVDSELIGFGKTITELSFCYGVGSGDIGYAPCALSESALGAACAGRDGTFFVRYDITALATGQRVKPELCACSGVTTEACVPDPTKPNSCGTTGGSETLLDLSTQSAVTTVGSPCRVTVCTSFFGRTICQQQTVTAPDPPCSP
jgi:hypothetical protein